MKTLDEVVFENVKEANPIVAEIMLREKERQEQTIELIASENFASDAVRAACASVFTNKYAEGYPETDRKSGRRGRYYGGCQHVDELEEYCCEKWREVFKTDYHVNVQPHSGSQANCAAYASVLNVGDTVLSMRLENGAHLTHGSSVNFSGKTYNFVFYGVDENGYIDYDDIAAKIRQYHPKMIVAGASAYPREIDFRRIRELINAEHEIAEEYGKIYNPYFMVDMAHIAGLVAAGKHVSPFGLADIITTTTHKTLRGPRGALIFCRKELANAVDGAVFPGTQGGPLEHIIAAKAICATECCSNEYKEYIERVIENTRAMSDEFSKIGFDLVTGGTDNHMLLIDFSKKYPWMTGKEVQEACDKYQITLNKNCVPGEKKKPSEASGIRIGCAAETTRGMNKDEAVSIAWKIATIIDEIVENHEEGA